jgi:spermidine synthase
LSADILRVSPALLYDTLRAAGIETRLITQAHLTERLQQRKRDWFLATLGDVPASPNRDFQPSAVFHQIAYENLMLTPFLKPIFAGTLKVSFPLAALFVVLLCCLVSFAGRKSARVALPFAITTTGFACMVTELMLIFGFQVVYGYVFYEIAILITAFMTGIAAGSLFVTSLLRARKQLRLFIFIEASLILFILSLIATFSFLETFAPSLPVATHLLFLLLLFFSGVFAGLEFPLATKIFQTTHSVERSVGVLYAADLAGGWIGGLVTGFLLFPIVGLFNTCLLVALLKAGSFTFLLVQQKRGIIS